MRSLRSLLIATVLLALMFAPSAATAAPADLDRSFGTFGRAFPTGFGPVRALVTLADGRTVGITSSVVRQGNAQGSIFRLTAGGAPDPTFGSQGSVSFSANTSSGAATADAIVQQPDGGLVVLGGNPLGRPRFVLARYRPDGTPDPAFGSQGRVESDAAYSEGLAVEPDGALVVAVSPCAGGLSCPASLARYTAGGVLDRTFGGRGAVRLPFGGVPVIGAAPHRRVVVAGARGDGRMGVARYRADGSLDPSFGNAGIATTAPAGLVTVPACILVQGDGRIVVCARDTRTRDAQSWLLRFRATGALDRGFGVRGAARMRGVSVRSVARQANGKLIAVGEGDLGAAFAVLRFRPDGRRDRGFGRRGRLLTDLDPGYDVNQAPLAVAIGRGGRLLVGGGLGFPDYRPVVVRYRGGASLVSGASAKGRYVVRVEHPLISRITGRFHRGDVVKVRLLDRRGGTQRYEVCFTPPPLGRGYCTGRRTGSGLVWRRLNQAGNWTVRFRIRATGEVILHTFRVFAPSR